MVAKNNGGSSRRGGSAEQRERTSKKAGPADLDRVPAFLREGTQVAREMGNAIVARVTEEATNATRNLRNQGEQFLARQRDAAAAEVGHVSAAIREAAERLNRDQMAGLSEYAESAANGIERVSKYLTEKDLHDVAGDVEQFAHRQPALFLGGMAVAGFVIGRFVRAGKPRAASESGSKRSESQTTRRGQ